MKEELELLIEQYEGCNSCLKTSNYPKEWLDEMTSRKKQVWIDYETKVDRLGEVNVIHDEYSKRFDDEGRTVYILYKDKSLTLEQAKQLLDEMARVD